MYMFNLHDRCIVLASAIQPSSTYILLHTCVVAHARHFQEAVIFKKLPWEEKCGLVFMYSMDFCMLWRGGVIVYFPRREKAP